MNIKLTARLVSYRHDIYFLHFDSHVVTSSLQIKIAFTTLNSGILPIGVFFIVNSSKKKPCKLLPMNAVNMQNTSSAGKEYS